jgi:predicted AAA+ superfamily ATPase
MIRRRIETQIQSDLLKKMVILSGPRQCGKTTLARDLLKIYPGIYMNWDDTATRLNIQKSNLDHSRDLWVFDELHKYRRWRNFLKGLYDLQHEQHKILVTGSARLDAFSRGGDSLQGRYYSHRLHPFTFSEVAGIGTVPLEEVPHLPKTPDQEEAKTLDSLMTLGGFPEPFLSGSQKEANRWRLSYGSRLIQEEVRTLEDIKNLDRLELLFDRFSEIAGSVISINSLREDLEVAFETIKNWVIVFEKFYSVFRISPYGPPKFKSVKKEQKLYFWDWSRCAQEGARFENLLAMHLLRWSHWVEDTEGEKLDIRFFKNRDGHEVDFVVLRKKKPWIAIETKVSDSSLAPSLRYFLERNSVPYAFQVVGKGGQEKRWDDINGCKVRSVSAARFLANLP